jgi:hypothetical protein
MIQYKGTHCHQSANNTAQAKAATERTTDAEELWGSAGTVGWEPVVGVAGDAADLTPAALTPATAGWAESNVRKSANSSHSRKIKKKMHEHGKQARQA